MFYLSASYSRNLVTLMVTGQVTGIFPKKSIIYIIYVTM